MDKRRRGPILPDAVTLILKPLAFKLEEALQEENLYRPDLLAIDQNDLIVSEVTLSLRDEAVNDLRFLRTWTDLPRVVFFSAVSYLDMFLARMKVQQKFLKCLTLSCLYIAAKKENHNLCIESLVKISKSKFSSRDVIRMAGIVKERLKLDKGPIKKKPTTVLDFLLIYLEIFKCLTKKWEHIISRDLMQIREKMMILLEVLLTDNSTAFLRSSALALVLFQIEVEKIMAQGLPNKSFYFLGEVLQFFAIVKEIQIACKIKNVEFKNYYTHVLKILKEYEGQSKTKYSQELNWHFSVSTVGNAFKCGSYHPSFQTIVE